MVRVTEVNGTALSVNSIPGKMRNNSSTATTATTYTVDASNAEVTKNAATSSVSSIAVGDTVMVQGTISGTNITATYYP